MYLDEVDISKAIVCGYHDKLLDRLNSDVIVVGAGPSGMVAAIGLARGGYKVTIIEKRLTPGGGVWGGAMAMNEVIVQANALHQLEQLGVRSHQVGNELFRVDAIELAAALTLHSVQSGAVLLNMTTVEDICLHDQRVSGVVVNRTGVSAPLPIDPLTMRASVVVDATGHDAAVVQLAGRRGLIDERLLQGEGPMNATQGEQFVVENTAEVCPGLWVCGMAVCATWGGPRMGPIFGGMLLSGQRCAAQIAARAADKC